MRSKVHQDERGLLVGYVQSYGVRRWLPTADIVLHFAVVQCGDELLDQIDLFLVFASG